MEEMGECVLNKENWFSVESSDVLEVTVQTTTDDMLPTALQKSSSSTEDTAYKTNLFITDSSNSSDVTDHFTPHGTKRNSTESKSSKNAKWDYCDGACKHKGSITPLPNLLWADCKCVWDIMMHKADIAAQGRNLRIFEISKTVSPRMRAILVEWIMEVCEVYRLRRSTYYLALDYIDRYISMFPSIPKNELQLLGITALYIAAKFDEIYSPKLSEFAYVCDGACTDREILHFEVVLLNALKWDINPMTPTSWLNIYMQLHWIKNPTKPRIHTLNSQESDAILFPQYSGHDFVKASHIMDLLSLDPCYLLFSYNVIAATALYYQYGRTCALKASGLSMKDMESCIEYVAVFYAIIRDSRDPKLDVVSTVATLDRRDRATFNFLTTCYTGITFGEYHCMQTRAMHLEYLEKACIVRMQRMGYSINKVFLNETICKLETSNETNNDAEINNDVETNKHAETKMDAANEEKKPDEEGGITVFEIERLCESTTFTNRHIKPILSTGYFENKSQYTLDELLVGINENTINNLVVPDSLRETAHKNAKEPSN